MPYLLKLKPEFGEVLALEEVEAYGRDFLGKKKCISTHWIGTKLTFSNTVTEMTDWEFTIVSLEAKSWQFVAATQEVFTQIKNRKSVYVDKV